MANERGGLALPRLFCVEAFLVGGDSPERPRASRVVFREGERREIAADHLSSVS